MDIDPTDVSNDNDAFEEIISENNEIVNKIRREIDEEFRLVDLKKICKSLSLKSSGNKPQIIDALIDRGYNVESLLYSSELMKKPRIIKI